MDRERVFAALFGAYVGCLLGPATALLVPGPTWPVTLAGFIVAAGVGYLAAEKLDLAEALTGFWRNASIVVFPFVYLPRVAFRSREPSFVEFVAVPATLGLLAVVPGFFVIVIGNEYRNRETLTDATVHAEFEARPAPKTRRWQFVGGVMVVLSGGFGALAFLFLDGDPSPGLFAGYAATAMGGLTTLLAAKDDEREVKITDVGVKVKMAIHDWNTFTDYEVTDDAVVLERPKWWHSSFKFDREDIENLDEVEPALRRYLPRE